MSEIRKNLVTGELVIIAPERAGRPQDHAEVNPPPPPSWVDSCVFCPGNEHLTPDETYCDGDATTWSVRSVPNKFSALSREGQLWEHRTGLQRCAAAVGPHEVIIESPKHDEPLGRMTQHQARRVIDAWHARFVDFYDDPRVRHVVLFENHGIAAGSSLVHPHAQLVGLPLPVSRYRARRSRAINHLERYGRCVVCETIDEERAAGVRVVLDTETCLALVPYAALSPYHLWILPKYHASSFAGATPAARADLAIAISRVLRAVARAVNDPAYNLVVLSGPPNGRNPDAVHWYVSIVPRVTRSAGFELGSGMYINPSWPRQSAATLRDAL